MVFGVFLGGWLTEVPMKDELLYLVEYVVVDLRVGQYFSSYSLAKATARKRFRGDIATTSRLISTFKPLIKQFRIASSVNPSDLLARDINFK